MHAGCAVHCCFDDSKTVQGLQQFCVSHNHLCRNYSATASVHSTMPQPDTGIYIQLDVREANGR